MELSWVIACLVGGLGLILLLIGLRRRFRSPGRRFCPGPRRHWTIRFLPWRLVFRPVCGHDLSGSPGFPEGHLTCAECGRSLKSPRQMLRSGHRLVAVRAGTGLLIVAMFVPWLVDMNWAELVRLVPSPPLVAMETMLLDDTPEVVRVELRGRMSNFELEGEDERKMIALLVRDLRNDDRVNNAAPAMELLTTCGDLAADELERSLDAPDHQLRQLAAHLLRRLPTYKPTARMLEVTLEGLAHDDLPSQRATSTQRHAFTRVCNAKDGTAYLACHAAEARDLLRRGMMSPDPQQRMLSAAATGIGGLHELIPQAAPILLEHLQDNDITGDAKLAAFALRRFGSDVRPALELNRDAGDQQSRRAIDQVLESLEYDEQEALRRERESLTPFQRAMEDAARLDWQQIYLPYLEWDD